MSNGIARRRLIAVAGATGLGAVLAGCADDDPDEDPDEVEEPADEDDEPDAEVDEADDENDEPDDNDDDDEDDEPEPIDPDEAIVLEGTTDGWSGVEPEGIADEENPTLLLLEGETYEITWENADGEEHNLEIRDDTYAVVEDYETELIEEEGETATLEIEATDEMVQYLCSVHETEMLGAIELEEDDENDDESD